VNWYKNIKDLLLLALLTLVIVLQGCEPRTPRQAAEGGSKWSVSLADAVMSRNDSLAIYNNPPSIRWQYDIAMLGQAIEKLNTTDQRYFNYYRSYIDYFIQNDGTILTYKRSNYKLDDFNPAKGLLMLYEKTGNEKYHKAIDYILAQLENQPRTNNGGYCHKEIYNHQIWLNSSYMLGPFLARYAHDFNQPQWYDTVCFQLKNTYNLTVDPVDGLLVHAWDETHQQNWADQITGKSPHKWGRGMGWYMMALVDVLEYLPNDHPRRNEMESILLEISIALLKVREKETGLWYQILDQGDKPYNYIETSCSAMFIYAFAKGANLEVLPNKYREIAKASFLSLTRNFIKTDVDSLPTLTQVSSSAGLGIKMQRDGSFEYYINQQQIDNEPKGVAPLIMAATELNL